MVVVVVVVVVVMMATTINTTSTIIVTPNIILSLHNCIPLTPSSGLVIDPRIKWVSFHSYYDFGYLLRICTCVALPESDKDFFTVLQRYPRLFFLCHRVRLSSFSQTQP